MPLRPATPLSGLLFVAFVLLLLSVLSAPVIPAINIASFGGVKFGVFGWCNAAQCSKVSFGYNMDSILRDEGKSDFALPSKARNSLTNLLIVHPIAALITLVLFVLSVLAHLHGPAHSPKYLLALLLLCLPALMICLLAFLVDILIFLPHLQWAGWIVLAATILIVVSGVVMCGMRRQIVGRLARSQRIQENAEMNGQNYLAQAHAPVPESHDKVPEFSTFEVTRSAHVGQEGERIPLNPRVQQEDNSFQRSNTLRTNSSGRSNYGPQPRGAGPLGSGFESMDGNSVASASQYSNQTLPPLIGGAPSGPYGSLPPVRGAPYGQHPADRIYGQPMPIPGPFDGPSGPPPGGRYGPGPSQGAYRGPPPPPPLAAGGFDQRRGAYAGYGQNPGPSRGPPPNGYGPGPGPGGYGPGPGGYGPPPRGPGPPAMGMATGLRAPPPRRPIPHPRPAYDETEYPAGIDNDRTDERQEFEQTLAPVPNHDMIGRALADDRSASELQEPATRADTSSASASGALAAVTNNNTAQPGYEGDSYIPPRTIWEQENRPAEAQPAQSPVELPAPASRQEPPPPSRSGSSKSKRASDLYYEDVAPQFDTPHNRAHTPPLPSSSPHPTALTPGPSAAFAPPPTRTWSAGPPPIPDDLDDGQRSPVSTASGFTSISQRGTNPRWQEEQNRLAPGRSRVPPARKSVGLAGNPDFELPLPGRGRGARGGFR